MTFITPDFQNRPTILIGFYQDPTIGVAQIARRRMPTLLRNRSLFHGISSLNLIGGVLNIF
jgi:hypothetical protein